jgi:hypothetical protein
MGCCQSTSGSDAAINSAPNSSNPPPPPRKAGGKEDKIELAFKAKRANIFTVGVDLERPAFTISKTRKSEPHTKLICMFMNDCYSLIHFLTLKCFYAVSAISQNYIFASLNHEDLDEVVQCMETVDVSAGENVVTQGTK